MTLQELLVAVDRIVAKSSIPYAVIGAYAVAAWGEVRGTRDLDVLIEAADLERLVPTLGQDSANIELRRGDEDDPIAAVIRMVVGHGADRQSVDIIAGIRGIPVGIVARAHRIELAGRSVAIASPEDMLILKLRAGSARDVEDARSIVRVQGKRLSRALLAEICPPDLAPRLADLLR